MNAHPSAKAGSPPAARHLRVACLASGRGTTVMNLADRIDRGELPVEIVLVAATKPGVPAIDAAAARGLPTIVIATDGVGGPDHPAPRASTASPRARAAARASGATDRTARTPAGAIDDALDRALAAAHPDLICLCGYLRLFRVGRWAGRVINIHPGPLPEFGGKGMYGARVHRAVIDAGLAETRCCVHLVDDAYDRGPLIADRRIVVLPADTPQSLEARVRQAEFELLPEVLRGIARGEIDLAEIASRAGRGDLSSTS